MAYKNHVISTGAELKTSGFGVRQNPTGAGTEMHNGLDVVDTQRREKTQNVNILSIADGTVVEYIVGDLVGYTVAISHEGKILSRYQHMKAGSVTVKVGDKVKKGQVIGVMGTTGRSTGIHLHFAVKENSTAYSNGTWVDPELYLTGEKIIPEDELKKLIEDLKSENAKLRQDLKDWTQNSRILYQWNDENMPDWARPTIHKMTQKKYLIGDEKGKLQLSNDMLRLFVTLDRAGAYD